WPKIHVCGVKNARKVFNFAALFALHTRFLPQKNASLVECRQPLALFTLFLFCLKSHLGLVECCQGFRKVRQSRMVLDHTQKS
ncbi:hypothetical protein, partial [Neisseria weixii]|uniref:hypothetical protein n=1 Tax=Neisseria weixii TaxID=1853276 RepID=UPI0035A16B03